MFAKKIKIPFWIFLIPLLLTVTASVVHSANGLLRDLPSDLKGPKAQDINQLTLGRSCQAMLPVGVTLPCNASFLAYSDQKVFVANGYIGDDYRKVEDYRRLLDAGDKFGLLDRAMKETDAVKAQAGTSLWMQSKNFSLTYVPLYVDFFNRNENRAYPEVGLHVSQEKALIGQYGVRVSKSPELSLGFQTRYVDRRYIHQEVALLDYVANPGIIQIQEQRYLYLEPSMAYFIEPEWKVRTTAQVSNWGIPLTGVREASPDVGPFLDWGLGFAPPIDWATLDFGVNYSFDPNLPNDVSRLRFGSAFSLGLMNAVFGFQPDDYSFGIISSFMAARVGISYRTQRLFDIDGKKKERSSAYVEFSLVL